MMKNQNISTMVAMTMAVFMVTATWIPDQSYNKRAEPTATEKKEEKPTPTATAKKENSADNKDSSTKKDTTSAAKKPATSTKKEASETHSVAASNSHSGVPLPTSTNMIQSPTSSALPSSAPSESSSSGSTAGIIGGVIAGIAAVGIGIVAFIVIKRKKRNQQRKQMLKPDPFTMGYGSDNLPPPQQQQQQLQQQQEQQYNYQFSPNMTANEPPQLQKQLSQQQQYDHYEVAAISTPPSQTPQAQEQQNTLGTFSVVATYIPTLSDELEIEVGDQIQLLVEYDDGWCQGINMTKGYTKGVFPRHCIDVVNNNNANNQSNLDIERSKRVSSMYQLK